MKQIHWKGSSLKDINAFSVDAKREAGFELYNVQSGRDPSDWKPMPSIGQGVREIRIHKNNEYRVIYVANVGSAVYVLHAFLKKTQKTSKRDIDLAKHRYREIKQGEG